MRPYRPCHSQIYDRNRGLTSLLARLNRIWFILTFDWPRGWRELVNDGNAHDFRQFYRAVLAYQRRFELRSITEWNSTILNRLMICSLERMPLAEVKKRRRDNMSPSLVLQATPIDSFQFAENQLQPAWFCGSSPSRSSAKKNEIIHIFRTGGQQQTSEEEENRVFFVCLSKLLTSQHWLRWSQCWVERRQQEWKNREKKSFEAIEKKRSHRKRFAKTINFGVLIWPSTRPFANASNTMVQSQTKRLNKQSTQYFCIVIQSNKRTKPPVNSWFAANSIPRQSSANSNFAPQHCD